MSKRKTFNILSIDGGGIRGIIPAMLLAEIEGRTLHNIRALIDSNSTEEEGKRLHTEVSEMVMTHNKKEFIPVSKLFDLVTGVSTGGILALALTVPDTNDENRARYTAEKLVGLYDKDGKKIFRRSFWHRLPGIGKIVKGVARKLKIKYSSNGIRCVVKKRFGYTKLSDALIPVIVLSYEMVHRCPWFFRSTRTAAEATQGTHDFLMTDVALATSAAPTYFNPHQMTATNDNGNSYQGSFIDGGIYANHPAMCAFVEGRDMEGEDILLVSLGTGERAAFFEGERNPGVFFWARRIFNVIFDGASDTVRYQLERLMPKCKRFYRFQPVLPEKNMELDNVDALPALRSVATTFINAENERLNRLCRCLAERFLQQL